MDYENKMKKSEFLDFLYDVMKDHVEGLTKKTVKEFYDDFNEKFIDVLKDRKMIQTWIGSFYLSEVNASPTDKENKVTTLRVKASSTAKNAVR